MQNKILIIKNISREGPGLLEDVLQKSHFDYTIVDLHQEEVLPPVTNYKAIIVLGGPDSANDHSKKIMNQLIYIREVLANNIPYLGICLGFQMLVKAIGGSIIANSIKEIGFIDPEGNNFKVELTKDGKRDPLFEGLGDSFKVFHLHGETVHLTNDLVLLASGKFCKNQIAKVGVNAYGIQCHFELTPNMFETWINEDKDLLKMDKKQLQKNFKSIHKEYLCTGEQLFTNFLKIVKN